MKLCLGAESTVPGQAKVQFRVKSACLLEKNDTPGQNGGISGEVEKTDYADRFSI